jgi:hypothetical protein
VVFEIDRSSTLLSAEDEGFRAVGGECDSRHSSAIGLADLLIFIWSLTKCSDDDLLHHTAVVDHQDLHLSCSGARCCPAGIRARVAPATPGSGAAWQLDGPLDAHPIAFAALVAFD